MPLAYTLPPLPSCGISTLDTAIAAVIPRRLTSQVSSPYALNPTVIVAPSSRTCSIGASTSKIEIPDASWGTTSGCLVPEIKALALSATLSYPSSEVHKRAMLTEDAVELVRQWENIKAEALGPTHQVSSLFQVLDESMLVQWQTSAQTARAKSCYWRFVLLRLEVLQAHIVSDGISGEIAEIEALLEEAAELVDESQPRNAKYYSTYKIRYTLKKKQEDGSWKFCESDIQIHK